MDGLTLHERSAPSRKHPQVSFPVPPSPTNRTSGAGTSPLYHRQGLRGLVHRTSSQALRSNVSSTAGDDRPEILAPQPRRHLLENSSWLRAQSMSPVSARAVSPSGSQVSAYDTAGTRMSIGRRNVRHQSFSSMHGSISGGGDHKPPKQEVEAGMGKRWIRWMDRQGMKNWVVPGAILASMYLRWTIGLGSYSGKATPPMFGDYEAQRHWMEITTHLPIKQWYTYDLQYWGLDYPPLTAYHSWLCGIVGSWIEPSWFKLDKSRGIESHGSQVFMRSTVLLWDLLIYIPAIWLFTQTWQASRSRRTQNLALVTLLFQPALLLIDFGHFQYNSIMLGFALLSLNFLASENDVLGAIFFVLSLGFKQMALYYAPAIGTYLVAKCIYLGPTEGSRLFVRLAVTTSLTLLVLFAPFLPPFASLSAVLDPIQRIFPFGRGLFEDKVSNFWCASNVVFKWKNVFSRGTLVKLSTLLTALGFAPGVVVLLQSGFSHRLAASENASDANKAGTSTAKPTPMLPLLVYVMLMASSSFFLFSFQVHEKSILLPLLPMTLLMSASGPESSSFRWGALMNNAAVFSMWPLLNRDGLSIQYFVLLVLWNRLIGYNPFKLPKLNLVQLASSAFYISTLLLHLLEALVTPPSRYPDLYAVLNVLVTTPVFVLCWLWSIRCTVKVAWALQGPGMHTAAPAHSSSASNSGSVKAKTQESLGRRLSVGESVGSSSARRTPIPSGFRRSPHIVEEPEKEAEASVDK